MNTGGRARRRLRVVLPGHHLHSGADVVRHPNERSRSDEPKAVSEEPEGPSRSRHRPTRRAERRPAIGPSRRCPRDGRFDRPELRPPWGRRRASRGDRASRWARLAASVWLLRCLSPPVMCDPRRRSWRSAACAAGARTGGFRPARPGRWRRPVRLRSAPRRLGRLLHPNPQLAGRQ